MLKIKINENFRRLPDNYLFCEIAKRVSAYQSANPAAEILRLGIGDVSLPLAPAAVAAMHSAADEMAHAETFHGYPPEQGYLFLRRAVSDYYKAQSGVDIDPDDIFISDGAKSDSGNITDILGDSTILITDPVYPVYADANIIAGHRVRYITRRPKTKKPCVVYLCYPNNPTGGTATYRRLQSWVDWARATGSLLIFDSAYAAFIKDKLPRSIFEIDGADAVAIEVGSLSKSAGFTGVRCSWTIVPKNLTAGGVSLRGLWARRQSTKFNGVSYVIQKAAAAALSTAGAAECAAQVAFYMENARFLSRFLHKKGIAHSGGRNAPYLWFRCPWGMNSWDFFDKLLTEAQIVGTPGAGFGAGGEGYFRFSAFGSRADLEKAIARMERFFNDVTKP